MAVGTGTIDTGKLLRWRDAVSRRSSGKAAEDAAARHLRGCGYRILERNYSTPLGEIDIIALDGEVVCFVEVRSHTTADYGSALEALTAQKRRRLRRAAMAYVKAKRIEEEQARFDFAAVEIREGSAAQVHLIKDAFRPGGGG